jgi:DNA-binding NarL/FixJ family response regulator
MSETAKILIVDDHPLVREGLAARIATQTDMVVCGEANDVEGALAQLDTSGPDLILVDLSLRRGHGLDLIKAVRRRDGDIKMLVVSAYEDSLFAERSLRSGAHGYINKQELQEKIIDAIRVVLSGHRYLDSEIADRLVGQAIGSDADRPRGLMNLTDRELEVFQLIGQGRSTRAIAEQLHLSVHTIESHRENIRSKLNLRNGTELMQHAVQWTLGIG